ETGMTLLVRTKREPSAILGELRHALLALEPDLPLFGIQPLSALLASSLFPARMAARLLTCFAALAVLLAAVGLYGAISFAVSRRTREMGIRSALGARGQDLMSLVIRESFTLVGLGLAIGGAVAASTTRVLTSFVYDISPTDPAIFVSVALLVAVVMVGATFFPARRASRSDPLIALRVE
ncbi:MAG: FtsX-like permease family protein, partial [Acidobacteria bacterium]|nr:FtsX-like permease family protein [Acidobacteriota bacterium]